MKKFINPLIKRPEENKQIEILTHTPELINEFCVSNAHYSKGIFFVLTDEGNRINIPTEEVLGWRYGFTIAEIHYEI